MPISVYFDPKDDDKYILKLNRMVDEHNAATGEVLAVGEVLTNKAAQFDAAVADTIALRDEAGQSAAAASQAKDAAALKAGQASDSATAAADSATTAGQAKDTAVLKANEAGGSATAAGQAKDVAVAKAAEAIDAASQAHTYAQQAQAAAIGRMPGETMVWPGPAAPAGWALCHGQLLQIADHPVLHAVLGAVYGGDDITTFAVPDLRGRMPLGASDIMLLGSTGGASQVNIVTGNLPLHAHDLNEVEGGVVVTNDIGNLAAETTLNDVTATFNAAAGVTKTATALGNALLSVSPSSPPNIYVTGVVPNIALHADTVKLGGAPTTNLTGTPTTTVSGRTDATGGGEALDVMPPYLAVNYIIFLG